MTEKINFVKNPLTIIAMFAGISEVSGAAVLPFLTSENQSTYILFLILFPVLLTVLFFLVLFFKHEVLYAPSDYQNEDNFIRVTKYNISDQNKDFVKITSGDISGQLLERMKMLTDDFQALKLLYTHKGTEESSNDITYESNLIAAYKVSVSNFENADEFIEILGKKGITASVYEHSHIKNVSITNSEQEALWLGNRVPYAFAVSIIKIAINFYPFIKYIHISGDGESDPPDYIHDVIYVGGATIAAKRYKLNPISSEGFKRIFATKNTKELHTMIRSFYESV